MGTSNKNPDTFFDGIIKLNVFAAGSKSESEQPCLVLDTGEKIRVYKETDNPFENKSLIVFNNKRVHIKGRIDESNGILIVDSIEEI